MDPLAGIEIFLFHLIGVFFYPPFCESPGHDSDPDRDHEDSSVKLFVYVERKIDEDAIPTMLDGNYGRSVHECASRMTREGEKQEFCDGFLSKHEYAFARCWKLLGINVPLYPDELQLKKVADNAAKWCLAFDFSDKMLSHMKEVLQKNCSGESTELVMDCFSKAAGRIMKRLLNYLGAIFKTNKAFLYYQENPTLLVSILAIYMLILEASWISSEDRENFQRLLAEKMQPMLAPDMLLHVHKLEACEGNGGIHKNTRKFMSFIGQVMKFDKVLAITGLPDGYGRPASVNVRDFRTNLLHGVIPKLLSLILSASKTLKPDLLLIAKMNNTQFILDAVIQMGLDTYLQIFAHLDVTDLDVSDFVKMAWSGVSNHLNSSTGFFPICWKPASLDVKRYIKAFHKSCSDQQDYVIIDYKLRQKVQEAIINEIISPYEEVFQFANARERNEEGNSPVSLKRTVRRLYEGNVRNFNHVSR